MNILKHIYEQPFISATGAAALVHSTWSLGTLMSGNQPIADFSISFVGWLVPALLIAFALDIGQIVTSAKIRHDGLTASRAVTFGIFAFATYYLQLLYCIHHVPSLVLADGVRGEWQGAVTLIRDASIWIIPMLLPLSTLLYTLSGKQNVTQVEHKQDDYQIIVPVIDEQLYLAEFGKKEEPEEVFLGDFLARHNQDILTGFGKNPHSKKARKAQAEQEERESTQTTPKDNAPIVSEN
jgi:hypothetical protein